ncbi:hypothetical protein [Sinorhizobium fredii]|uniref:hypothetical protein n=1 Tax=Rhizobium fredii TaxID=380 RepID=UPI000B2AA137|nr:hypothetical protein [Sinorhizobium fredii]WOS64428.1 hypothetical protein SFGR64A_08720 [Sinorhizobium fredii GR64]
MTEGLARPELRVRHRTPKLSHASEYNLNVWFRLHSGATWFSDVDYGSLRVEVRSSEGKLLATVVPSEGRGCEQFALIARRHPGAFRYQRESAVSAGGTAALI